MSVEAQAWAQYHTSRSWWLSDSVGFDDRAPRKIYLDLMEGFCHACGEQADRESVNVEVGIIYGPWGCYCGWSEDPRYNQLRSDVQPHTDPFGFYYPTRADRAQ